MDTAAANIVMKVFMDILCNPALTYGHPFTVFDQEKKTLCVHNSYFTNTNACMIVPH